MRNGPSKAWGQIVDPHVNKNRAGLGFSVNSGKSEIMKPKSALGKYQNIFHSGGYLHPTVPRINAILEGEEGNAELCDARSQGSELGHH